MIIDCFLFFNELDLLEIRLNSLAPYVDRFVLVESEITHTCKEKPLYFQENRDRFKDFNITHVIAPPRKLYRFFAVEAIQRECIMNGIKDVDSEDIILSSDVDEIPDLSNYHGEEGTFKHKVYCYAFNVFTGDSDWLGTVAIKKKNIKHKLRVYRRRSVRERMKVIGSGWHFTSLGYPGEIAYKFDSIGHEEFNTPEIICSLRDNRKKLLDPYNMGNQYKVEMPSGPKYLLENQDKYPRLFNV